MHSKFILVFNVEQEHAHFFLTRIRFNCQWNFPSISMKVISSITKDFFLHRRPVLMLLKISSRGTQTNNPEIKFLKFYCLSYPATVPTSAIST